MKKAFTRVAFFLKKFFSGGLTLRKKNFQVLRKFFRLFPQRKRRVQGDSAPFPQPIALFPHIFHKFQFYA